MSFAAAAARLTSACRALGEPARFSTGALSPVETWAALDLETLVAGDLGQVLDSRPSVRMPSRAVGTARTGRVEIVGGRTWVLDRFISDDGEIVRFFVK